MRMTAPASQAFSLQQTGIDLESYPPCRRGNPVLGKGV